MAMEATIWGLGGTNKDLGIPSFSAATCWESSLGPQPQNVGLCPQGCPSPQKMSACQCVLIEHLTLRFFVFSALVLGPVSLRRRATRR